MGGFGDRNIYRGREASISDRDCAPGAGVPIASPVPESPHGRPPDTSRELTNRIRWFNRVLTVLVLLCLALAVWVWLEILRVAP
jgi:hypothetical protein